MGALTRIYDGLASLACALLALVIGGPPVWLSHKALQAGFGPEWAYAAVLALALVTLLVALDFFKKALRGINPLRDRPR